MTLYHRWFSLLLTLFESSKAFGSAGYGSLWDLNSDPNELNDLFFDRNYEDTRNALIDRLKYWEDLLVLDDDSDSTDDDNVQAEAYLSCGGICPFVDETYELSVDQIYSRTENPPHVVFVLVDDWGYNDLGLRSSYLSWTTPTIDKLAKEGILLDNYFTLSSCAPSRAALMTGRFPGRFGMLNDLDGKLSLPLDEVTLAQEMKSAGYVTRMVGKWNLGHASRSRLPTYRGFDSFYGYYQSFIDYYTKKSDNYLDLHDGEDLVTDESELSTSYHSAFLFDKKAREVISDYATSDDSSKPLFFLYSLQLVHSPYEAPSQYTERCVDLSSTSATEDDYNYCGMNLMLDEVIANLTCTLGTYDMLDNTVLIVASDNGGASDITGDSYPFRGHKYNINRGGISVNAFITSPLIPSDRRGSHYAGQMHVSDWLPTIMSVATNGEWSGGYTGNTIDGVNMWDAILTNASSPRSEIVHYINSIGRGSIQIDMIKLDYLATPVDFDNVTDYFESDLAPSNSQYVCRDPYVVSSTDATTTSAPTEEPTEENSASVWGHSKSSSKRAQSKKLSSRRSLSQRAAPPTESVLNSWPLQDGVVSFATGLCVAMALALAMAMAMAVFGYLRVSRTRAVGGRSLPGGPSKGQEVREVPVP